MNRPDGPRTPIAGIPGRTVAVPVWLLLVAGASLVVLSAGIGVGAGVLIGRASVEAGQSAPEPVSDSGPTTVGTAR